MSCEEYSTFNNLMALHNLWFFSPCFRAETSWRLLCWTKMWLKSHILLRVGFFRLSLYFHSVHEGWASSSLDKTSKGIS